MSNILKIGHRGAAGYEPENTLLSFRKALELHVDVVELDVYICLTGELVVTHDYRLEKTTNGKGDIRNLSFEELRKLDAGKGEKIPTLEEVFSEINNRAIVNIELKGEGMPKLVSELIKKYIRTGSMNKRNFLITSFNHHYVKEFREFLPEVSVGLIQGSIPLTYAEFAEVVDAEVVVLNHNIINEEYIKDAHGRGIKVYVYTVNDKDDINRVKSWGVDGIISNYPDRI